MLKLICAFLFVLALLTDSAHAQSFQADYTASIGADAWTSQSVPVRYQPDYSTANPWRAVNPWAKASGTLTLGDIRINAAARYNPVDGSRVDRLDADFQLTDSTGVRVGPVLPYRVSTCPTYDAASPWISSPNVFCRFTGLAEMSTGGAGAQAYGSTAAGDWLIDIMGGAYKPSLDGQDKKLAIYVPVGPNTRHDKIGASLNATNTDTGTQIRASWLRSWQDQASDAGGYLRILRYDTVFAGVEKRLSATVEAKASAAAYIGGQVNPAYPYTFRAVSTTAELSWTPRYAHTLSIGANHYQNTTTYTTSVQRLRVPSVQAAYRYDMTSGRYLIIQALKTQDTYIRQTGTTDRSGTSIGIRIAQNF